MGVALRIRIEQLLQGRLDYLWIHCWIWLGSHRNRLVLGSGEEVDGGLAQDCFASGVEEGLHLFGSSLLIYHMHACIRTSGFTAFQNSVILRIELF